MKTKLTSLLLLGTTLAAVGVAGFNGLKVRQLEAKLEAAPRSAPAAAAPDVRPKGVPAWYGKELGVAYDDVSLSNPARSDAAIGKLAQLDRDLTLDAKQMERYVRVLYRTDGGISCEYCCDAPSVITADGQAACSCEHSFAMRGLAKYLIARHGEHFTDRQILAEVGKWKTLFYPEQMQRKANILQSRGEATDMATLASNQHRGIEKTAVAAAGEDMAGKC